MPAFAAFRDHQIESLDQRFELGVAERDRLACGGRQGGESPALQALAPHAVAAGLEVQALELGAPAVDEDETVAAQRILAQLSANQGGQAIIRATHVGGLGAQPERDRRAHHAPRRKRRQTPSPRSSSISQPRGASSTASSSGTDTGAKSAGSAAL